MNTGMIVLHCWEDMKHPTELKVIENIKTVLVNSNLPIMGSVITREDVKVLIPHCVEQDLMLDEHKDILEKWVNKHQLQKVLLIGLHYNLCVRQLETRLFELCKDMGRDWNNNFQVQVIEDCTAASVENKIYTMQQYKHIGETHNLITMEQWTNTL